MQVRNFGRCLRDKRIVTCKWKWPRSVLSVEPAVSVEPVRSVLSVKGYNRFYRLNAHGPKASTCSGFQVLSFEFQISSFYLGDVSRSDSLGENEFYGLLVFSYSVMHYQSGHCQSRRSLASTGNSSPSGSNNPPQLVRSIISFLFFTERISSPSLICQPPPSAL